MKPCSSLLTFLVGALLAGCATPRQGIVSRNLAEAMKDMRTVGVVVAEAQFKDSYADGSVRVNVEKTDLVLSRFGTAAVNSLQRRNYDAVPLPHDDEIRRLITEYFSLRSSVRRAYREGKPIEAVPPIDSVHQVATARGVDAVALVDIDVTFPGGDLWSPITKPWRLFWNTSKAYAYASANLVILDANGKPIYWRYFVDDFIGLSTDKSIPGTQPSLWDICEELAADLPLRSR